MSSRSVNKIYMFRGKDLSSVIWLFDGPDVVSRGAQTGIVSDPDEPTWQIIDFHVQPKRMADLLLQPWIVKVPYGRDLRIYATDHEALIEWYRANSSLDDEDLAYITTFVTNRLLEG